MSFRGAAKGLAELALVRTGSAALARRRMRGRSLVLAYHNIVPDDAPSLGDLPNHLPQSSFARQLDILAETHTAVSLDELMDSTAGARGNRPRVAITFDDAYRGTVLLGVQELARRGMPATIFVPPGLLGGQSFWWDALAQPGLGLSSELRDRALSALAGDDTAIREWAGTNGFATHPLESDYWRTASEAELARAVSQPGITLGSHTWSHLELTKISPARLAEELERPREWLGRFAPRIVDWIAYPYGAFNETVMSAAADAGYRGALAVSGGWIPRLGTSPFAVPRLNVSRGLSERGFALRLAGLLTS